jgi:HlyD family secretion protein
MRAGYSATAEIFIARRENVLVLPERVIEYRDDDPFVRIPGNDGTATEQAVTLGLGDGLVIEVTSGLQEGNRVLEREYPQVE